MSIRQSDKCTTEEMNIFRHDVMEWLKENFDITKIKIRFYNNYNGDARIYLGHVEYTNRRSSFRRGEAKKNETGEIVGYLGTRGHHTVKVADYIAINRDEFENIKKNYKAKSGDDYEFQKDYIFDKLTTKEGV